MYCNVDVMLQYMHLKYISFSVLTFFVFRAIQAGVRSPRMAWLGGIRPVPSTLTWFTNMFCFYFQGHSGGRQKSTDGVAGRDSPSPLHPDMVY
jgi:hypothetical protein